MGLVKFRLARLDLIYTDDITSWLALNKTKPRNVVNTFGVCHKEHVRLISDLTPSKLYQTSRSSPFIIIVGEWKTRPMRAPVGATRGIPSKVTLSWTSQFPDLAPGAMPAFSNGSCVGWTMWMMDPTFRLAHVAILAQVIRGSCFNYIGNLPYKSSHDIWGTSSRTRNTPVNTGNSWRSNVHQFSRHP